MILIEMVAFNTQTYAEHPKLGPNQVGKLIPMHPTPRPVAQTLGLIHLARSSSAPKNLHTSHRNLDSIHPMHSLTYVSCPWIHIWQNPGPRPRSNCLTSLNSHVTELLIFGTKCLERFCPCPKLSLQNLLIICSYNLLIR